jgi:hypothetical protein
LGQKCCQKLACTQLGQKCVKKMVEAVKSSEGERWVFVGPDRQAAMREI